MVSLDELKKLKYCQKLSFGDEVYLASIVESLIEERDKRIAELENTVKDDRQKAAELIGHWMSKAINRADEINKLNKSVQDLDLAKRSAEVVFQSLLDAGLIQSWYFNGEGYHALLKANSPYVEIADLKDQIAKKDEEISALKKVIEMADAQYFKMRNSYEKESLENQKMLRGIK